MSEQTSRPGNQWRFRFTLRSLLLLMSFWAGMLYVWITYIREPVTHAIPLYERAPSTRRLSIRIGPNTIRIKRIVRNRRDGSLSVETGHGAMLTEGKVANKQPIIQAAPWLDVVQIELEPGPELLDILEVRIFDHKTRTILGDIHPNFGWQVLRPNLLQLYGIGKELPNKLDIWLRLQSYDAKDQVTRLEPTIGASCALPGGVLTLKDIRRGYSQIDLLQGCFVGKKYDELEDLASAILSWQGTQRGVSYQVEAVLDSGEKHRPTLQLLHPDSRKFEAVIFHGLTTNEKIDHFELRPFGGRHRFFFEGVQLPRSNGKAFVKPPVALLKIEGKEIVTEIPEFAPLTAKLSTHRGDWALGTDGRGRYVMQKPGGVTAVEEEFTLVYHMRGLGDVPWQFRFRDSITGKLNSESEASPHMTARSSGLTSRAGHKSFRTPLKQIEAIEVTLQPVP